MYRLPVVVLLLILLSLAIVSQSEWTNANRLPLPTLLPAHKASYLQSARDARDSYQVIHRRRGSSTRLHKRACQPLDVDCGNGFCCQALHTCVLPAAGSGGDTQCQLGGGLGSIFPGVDGPAYADPDATTSAASSSRRSSSTSSTSTATSSSTTATSSSSTTPSKTATSTSSASSTASTHTSTASSVPDTSSSGLSGGAIAGIVIGVFAAIAILAALASALYNYLRRRDAHEPLGSISGDHSASEMKDLGHANGSSRPGTSGTTAITGSAAAATAATSGVSANAVAKEKELPPLTPAGPLSHGDGRAGAGAAALRRTQEGSWSHSQQQMQRPLATMPNFGPVVEMDGGGLGSQMPRAEMMGDVPLRSSPSGSAADVRAGQRQTGISPSNSGSRRVPVRKAVYEMPG